MGAGPDAEPRLDRALRRRPGLRRAWLAALGAGLLVASALGPPLAAQDPTLDPVVESGEPLDIGADTLTVGGDAQEARFVGNVVARRGDWVLRCPELVARYDANGNLLGADAAGPVVLTGPDVHAEAQSAHFDRQADAIVLEGEPSLRRGQSVLKATRVLISLADKKVELQGVRGRIQLRDADLPSEPREGSTPTP